MKAILLVLTLFSVFNSALAGGSDLIPACENQTATSKTCGRHDYDGKCLYFNEVTYSGRYCGEASVCGRNQYDGTCIYFNTEAACGDRGCTKSKTCGRSDYDGNCLYFNEAVSCR